MKIVRITSWEKLLSASALAALVTTLGILPQARGELVYEPEVSPQAPAQVRADDREQMRTALAASEKAQATVQAAQPVQQQVVVAPAPVAQPVYQQPVYQQPVYQQPVYQQPVYQQQQVAVAPVQQVAPAPVYAAPQAQVAPIPTVAQAQAPAPQGVSADGTPQTDVQSLSKTELMRRERTRTELKNEDLLEERLEELRLRDEKKRTDQLLGQDPSLNNGGVQTVQSVAPVSGLATQGVVSPVTDHAGVQMAAPVSTVDQANAAAPQLVSPYTQAAQYQQASAQSVATSQVLPQEESHKSSISLVPHFGVSSMSSNSIFNVTSGFSAGADLDLPISDNVAFELGYSYNQYGVSTPEASSSYYYGGYSPMYGSNLTLKQNVITAGVKAHVLGEDYRFRPYVAGGGGYAMASLNLPDTTLNTMPTGYQPQSYSSDAFLAYIGVGFDASVAKNVSLGASFRYYDALSSNSSNSQVYYGYNSVNPTTAYTGASLSESSFYTFAGDCAFSF